MLFTPPHTYSHQQPTFESSHYHYHHNDSDSNSGKFNQTPSSAPPTQQQFFSQSPPLYSSSHQSHSDLALEYDPLPRSCSRSDSADQIHLSLEDSPPMLAASNDTMSTADTWLPQGDHQYTPRSSSHGRVSHQRESSLSSLGSTGPASPYSHNTANPQIAMTDSMADAYHGLPYYDDSSYQLAKSMHHTTAHSALYASSAYAAEGLAVAPYASLIPVNRAKGHDRAAILPMPELSNSSTRSRPVSVASSIISDSPPTPAPEHIEERRRKAGSNNIPKLDRTMTDVYSDELYSPSFTITAASPSRPNPAPVSPPHDVFSQRLQAANTHHNLSAAHTPESSASPGKSPFRAGMGAEPAPPGPVAQTISPKDAILEFNDTESDAADYPLFGSSQSSSDLDKSNNVGYHGLHLGGHTFDFSSAPLQSGLTIPQHYPFVAHPSHAVTAMNAPHHGLLSSGVASNHSSPPESRAMSSSGIHRPSGVYADSGTYTCTYHGCTKRFETPALLQRHKREGHRQGQGLSGPRRADPGMTSALLNSQAGPHRCERINPSTGKPCHTVFSRPYDLTRHEDTIHNARKQKVRCDLCTEEKSFSRADALTRHYRVCHPDAELPGKQKRRTGSSTT